MFITYNKPKADAEEELKKLEQERIDEENMREQLEQQCIAEAEEQFRVNPYCPTCGCEVAFDDERTKVNKQRAYMRPIWLFPDTWIYTEISGLEMHCPHCGSNFIENETYKTKLTDDGKTVLKIVGIITAIIALIACLAFIIVKNADAIENAFNVDTTSQNDDLDQSTTENNTESTDDEQPLPKDLMNTLGLFSGIIGVIMIFASMVSITRGLISSPEQTNWVTLMSGLLLGCMLVLGGFIVHTHNESESDPPEKSHASIISSIIN
jgi:hypothetical protein